MKRTALTTKCKRGDRIVADGPVVVIVEHTAGARVRIEADESVTLRVERAPVLVVKKLDEPRS
jgi:preprotein translocase subunit YajC